MGEKKKSSHREKSTSAPYIKILTGVAVSSVLYFAVLALFSAIALNSGVSASSYMPAGMATGALTGFLCGFIVVRPIKEKGFLYGAVSGFVHSLVCSAVLFVVNNASAGNGIFILCALIIAFSVLGGIAAVNLKIKKKY